MSEQVSYRGNGISLALSKDEIGKSFRFEGEVSFDALESVQLDRHDAALFFDVSNDKKASAADWLLLLEMIFRRYAEQSDKSKG